MEKRYLGGELIYCAVCVCVCIENTMLTLLGSTIINLTLLTIFIEFGLPYPHEDLHYTRHQDSLFALDPSNMTLFWGSGSTILH